MSPQVRVTLASLVAAIGGLMFGYDTGVISGALLQLRSEFHLTCIQMEMVVSSLLIGALIASLFGGFLVDFCGRKETIFINDVIFLIGTVMLTAAGNFPTLICGRVVVGFAVSLSATADCTYIAEISPPRRRGMLVSLNEFAITIGFLVAYLSNTAFLSVTSGWRVMFAMGGVMAVLQAGCVLFLPASPRFFVLRGKFAQAKQVLAMVLDNPDEVDSEFARIQTSVDHERSQSLMTSCREDDGLCRRFLVAAPLPLLQQLTGEPSLLFYAPFLFRQLGFQTDASAVLATVGLGVVKMLVTGLFLYLTTKFGRRTLLLVGTTMMLVGTVVLAILLGAIFNATAIADVCADDISSNSSTVVNETESVTSSYSDVMSPGSWFGLVCVLLLISGYSIGFGPCTWLLLSELFPSHIKGRAMAVATSLNWAVNLIVSMTFLQFVSVAGASTTFSLFAVVCALSLVYVGLCVPETKDRSLEDVTSALRLQQQRLRSCCAQGRSSSWCVDADDHHLSLSTSPTVPYRTID